MWETFANAMKVFLEKHFIPTVISITAAILAIIFFPSDYWMIEKVGKLGLFILVFCITLLLVEALIAAVKGLKKRSTNRSNEEYRKQKTVEEEQECVEWVWSIVDRFSSDDRTLISHFLETNNAPVYDVGFYMIDSLLGSSLVKTSKVTVKGRTTLASGNVIELDEGDTVELQAYVLDNEWFKMLKFSKEKYGKICHFE